MTKLSEVFMNMEYGPAPESAAGVNAWLEGHNRSFGLMINNQWVHPPKAKTFPSLDPATGDTLAVTTQAEQAEIDQAVAAARQAFKTWGKTFMIWLSLDRL